jgi:hypothetical protein
LTDSGGEVRLVPRLTWQVGHSLTNLEISSFGTLCKECQLLSGQRGEREYEPRIYFSDLGRRLVSATVLTLFVCLGQNLKQLLSDCNRLPFVANLFHVLGRVSAGHV